MSYTNYNLLSIVYYAYNQYVDAAKPAWIGTERYNIEAKIPPGTTVAEFRLMLQNLLVDRFHIVVHHETREYDGYDLLVAKGGPKMKKSSEEDAAAAELTVEQQLALGPLLSAGADAKGYPQLLRPGITSVPVKNTIAFHLMVKAQTLSELIEVLKNYLGSPIVDKTGLSGRYDCTLDFHRGALVPGMQEPDDLIPYIPLAVEQIGLKMVPVKVPVDTLVVDSAEMMPTEN